MAEADEPKAECAPKAANGPEAPGKRKRRRSWRPWLRTFHRDVGYLLVGLTVVYAVSGLAVNHIDDWNANFIEYERTHQLGALPGDDQAIADAVGAKLGIEEEPTEVFRYDEKELEILYDQRTLVVRTDTGEVKETGREDRFFVRVANWLHLNRGKAAWTYIADGYAVLLLFLATSGLFMLPGKKGLLGRGAIIAAVGAAVPILYVTFSGGP